MRVRRTTHGEQAKNNQASVANRNEGQRKKASQQFDARGVGDLATIAGRATRRPEVSGQHPIPPYVVDFYCEAYKLVVEVDGSQHSVGRDRIRTNFLERRGLTVLRFHANEALGMTDAVVEAIWNFVSHRALTPTPLPEGEGLTSDHS